MKKILKPDLVKPVINGSIDEWGYILNENIDKTLLFVDETIQDLTKKNDELARLDEEKIDKTELPTFVKNTVDNYIESEVKPNLTNTLDEHVTTVNKPDLDSYTDAKKRELDAHEKLKESQLNTFTTQKESQLNSYVESVNKPELTRFTESQKPIIQSYTEEGKQAITEHTEVKKGELDTKTNELLVEQKKQLGIESGKLLETQKSELDKHEQSKEVELNNYVNNTSKVDIDNFTDTQKTELNDYVDTTNKPELDRYTETKKPVIDGYTNEAKIEITNHVNTKKEELDNYTSEKKEEITLHTTAMKQELTEKTDADKSILDSYTTDKKAEITAHTSTKLGELDSKTEENKGVLDSYEKTKEQEISSFVDITVKPDITKHADAEKNKSTIAITEHTNAEIERINTSTDIKNKLDKGGYVGTAQDLKSSIDSKIDKSDIIDNLTTGGSNKVLSAEQGKRLFNIADGKLDKTSVVNDLTTGGSGRALSAEMGKELNDRKFDKSGGDITGIIQIKKNNPYIYFDDTRTPDQPRGFVGYGSGEGILQLANGRSGYSVNLYPDGTLKYNQNVIFHRGNFNPAGISFTQINKGVNYDTVKDTGWYQCVGSYQNPDRNAPYPDSFLMQVWRYSTWTYQRAVSYYDSGSHFVRCFQDGVNNVPWEKEFNTKNSPIQKSNNGYQKLPSGLIIQWGESTGVGSTGKLVTFPIAFSGTNSYSLTITQVNADNIRDPLGVVGNFNQYNFTAKSNRHENDIYIKWIAIGY